MSKSTAYLSANLIALLATAKVAHSQDVTTPAQTTIGQAAGDVVPTLAVMNSLGATLSDGKLVLNGVAPNSVVFAGRPVRAAGHALTSDIIKQWGQGEDSFAQDPPNTTVSVLSPDGKTVEDAIVVLKDPKLEGADFSFDVQSSGATSKGPWVRHRSSLTVRAAWRASAATGHAWRLLWTSASSRQFRQRIGAGRIGWRCYIQLPRFILWRSSMAPHVRPAPMWVLSVSALLLRGGEGAGAGGMIADTSGTTPRF